MSVGTFVGLRLNKGFEAGVGRLVHIYQSLVRLVAFYVTEWALASIATADDKEFKQLGYEEIRSGIRFKDLPRTGFLITIGWATLYLSLMEIPLSLHRFKVS